MYLTILNLVSRVLFFLGIGELIVAALIYASCYGGCPDPRELGIFIILVRFKTILVANLFALCAILLEKYYLASTLPHTGVRRKVLAVVALDVLIILLVVPLYSAVG